MAKAGVIGSGSWGTALARVLSKNGHEVTLWSRREEESRMLREERENKSKLPGVKIPDDILCTTDLEQTVEGKDILVLATASPSIRSMAKKMAPYVADGQIIVDVSKGIEDSTLPGNSVVRTEPCGRSGKRHSHHCGSRSKRPGDS